MKILFANFPADGHFNPLTGLAVYLQQQGHDVRWYTSQTYAGKLRQMRIPHYPFKRAMDLSGDLLEEVASDSVRGEVSAFDMKAGAEVEFFGEKHLLDLPSGFEFAGHALFLLPGAAEAADKKDEKCDQKQDVEQDACLHRERRKRQPDFEEMGAVRDAGLRQDDGEVVREVKAQVEDGGDQEQAGIEVAANGGFNEAV